MAGRPFSDMLARRPRGGVPAIQPRRAPAELVRSKDALDRRRARRHRSESQRQGERAPSPCPAAPFEFRADLAAPTHDPAFRTDRPILLYCGSGGRAGSVPARGAARPGVHRRAQPRRGFKDCIAYKEAELVYGVAQPPTGSLSPTDME